MLTSLFVSLALAVAAPFAALSARVPSEAAPTPGQDPAAAPDGGPDAGRAAAGIDAELRALVEGGRDLAAARARAKELGRELLVVVTSDRLEDQGDAALSLQERLVYGVVLADPRVRERLAERFLVVSVAADFEALRAAADRAFIDDRVVDVPSASKPVQALAPPALAILGPDGDVARALERVAPVDAGTVAAWLAGAPLRVELAENDEAGAAYVAAALRPVAEQGALLAPLVTAEPGSPWALKARARREHPELFASFELLRAPIREIAEFDVLREARMRLGEALRADGSCPATDALGAPQATALVALALHLGGEHDAAQRPVEWLGEWLAAERLAAERLAAERLAAERPAAERPAAERPAAEGPPRVGERDPLLLSLWLDIQLARYDVGWSRSEEVEAAIAALAAAALPSGGWAAGVSARGAFAAGCCVLGDAGPPRASSVHTGFALDALLRAGVPGFPLDATVVERATEALVALRTPSGDYSDLALPRSAGAEDEVDGAGMRGLTLAADAALARQGRLKRKDVVAAIDAYFAEFVQQNARAGFGGVGRRHPAETGETRALGWLAYARLTDAAPGRDLVRRDGWFRRVVAAGAGADSTWLDTCDQGWVMATALASIALDATR